MFSYYSVKAAGASHDAPSLEQQPPFNALNKALPLNKSRGRGRGKRR